MKAHGVEVPGFLTHKPLPTAKSRYSGTRYPLAETKERTGQAFARGLTDLTHEHVVNQHMRSLTLIDQHDRYQNVFNKLGTVYRKTDQGTSGFFKNFDQAERAKNSPAVRAQNPHNLDLVAVRVPPQYARLAQTQAIKEGLRPSMDQMFHDAPTGVEMHSLITDAAKPPADRYEPGSYVLMAADAVQRIRDTEAHGSPLGSLGRAWTTQFRKAVLPSSPKRVLGLPIEQGVFRMLPARAGPVSHHFAAKVLDRASQPDLQTPESIAALGRSGKAMVDQTVARALGGQLAGQTLREEIHGNAERYRGNRLLYPAVKILDGARGTPGSGHIMRAWNAYAHAVLSAETKAFEGVPQMAYLGRFYLDQVEKSSGITWGKAARLQGQAFDDFVKGLIGSPKEVEAARAVDLMGGQYSKIGPLGRKALMASPFGMWWVNSLKFMYATMPHDHPIITGLMAAANTATQETRAPYGLTGPFAGTDQVQGFEQGGIPVGGPSGQILAQQYYSPPGAIADPFGTAASMILPQVDPTIEAARGLDFKNAPATTPGGTLTGADRAKLVVNAMLGTLLGGLYTDANDLAAGGATTYDTSMPWNVQVKGAPGSTTGAIDKIFKPVRLYPNYRLKKPASTSGGRSFGGSTGGRVFGGLPTGGRKF